MKNLPDNLRFLVVDDMENMRRSIRAMLRLIQPTWKVTEAADGLTAWRIIEAGEPTIHCIVSDWNMPGLTGTELLHRVRSHPPSRRLPFLMITAEANREIVAEAAENAVDAYLTKPFVTVALEQKISQLLHHAANPDPLTLALDRVEELEEAGEIDKALTLARRAAELGRRSSRIHRILGRLYLKSGQRAAAREQFQAAVATNVLDVASYHFLGEMAYQDGNLDEAVQHFARALDINPRNRERALRLARLLMEQGKPRKAEKIFRLLLKNNPGNLDLQQEVADACLAGGLAEQACRLYEAVLQADPNRTYLHRRLGQAAAAAGNWKEAAAALERAVIQTPDDATLLALLARASLELRQPARAEKYAVQAVRLDPANKEAQAVLDRLT